MEREECIDETLKHIHKVQHNLIAVIIALEKRAKDHDASKLEEPELSGFMECTNKLAGLTYGSDEYKEQLARMKPFLDHHYKNNPHHPECHASGVDSMTLVDLVEMFCDWSAATARHNDGDIHKSIQYNEKRFNISPQLSKILSNTVDLMKHKKGGK